MVDDAESRSGGRLYRGAVVGLGAAAFVAMVAAIDPATTAESLGTIALLGAFVLIGEVFPVRVLRRGDGGEITLSSPFALGLLPVAGAGVAALVLVAGSFLADVWGRKPWRKVLFNMGQYSISLGVAAGLLSVLRSSAAFGTGVDPAFAILGAGLGFLVVNTLLTLLVIALSQGVPPASFLQRDGVFQFSVLGALLAMTPMVVVLSERTLWLVPLLIVPAVAVHQSARLSLEREHAALHDRLTQLPNRTLFSDLLAEEIDRAAEQVAVLFVDIDRFREVNDTLGHATGDRLLQLVGPRLRIIAGPQAVIARLGGDEFAVLLPFVADPGEAAHYADRMLRVLEEPFRIGDFSLTVEAHVGIALHPDHVIPAEELLRRADVALYLAKERRSGIEIYSGERDTQGHRRLSLLNDLRRALDDGQLVLFFQPKADLRTGTIAGVEALLRWQHPVHGLVLPDEFIPLAEHTALMAPLTAFVLDTAIRECRAWRDTGLEIRVAVNLSVRSLYDPGLLAEVGTLLDQYGLDAAFLELEITESSIMADPSRALETLRALHRLGVKLAIDDYGTGYSSLSYLKRLPVDQVKIDRSFIQHMTTDDSDAAIVESTIDLAGHLGMEVVAEGVESEEVWDALIKLGCDYAQGNFLCRALPAEELSPGLRAGLAGLRLIASH